MSVTIKDIAKIVGLNYSTVSRGLNDSPRVKEKTREKIKKIAKELNFEFNSHARSLSTKKTGTIGIIFPEINEDFIFSYYLSIMISNIQAFFSKIPYDCIINTPVNTYTGESNILKILNTEKVDGLLIIHYDIGKDVLEKIENSVIPCIHLHYRQINHDMSKMNYILTDHVKGGYIATDHLLKLGMKNILTLTTPPVDSQFIERTEGYKKALKDNNLSKEYEKIYSIGKTTFDNGYNFVKNNLSLLKKSDAIFAQADIVAIGVINALNELRIRVPDDISVIGYDDIELATFVRPALTTIHQPIKEHIKLACSKISEFIENNNKHELLQEMFEPKLVIRQSCVV